MLIEINRDEKNPSYSHTSSILENHKIDIAEFKPQQNKGCILVKDPFLCVVLNGKLEIIEDGFTRTVQKGEMLLVGASTRSSDYKVYCSTDGEFNSLLFFIDKAFVSWNKKENVIWNRNRMLEFQKRDSEQQTEFLASICVSVCAALSDKHMDKELMGNVIRLLYMTLEKCNSVFYRSIIALLNQTPVDLEQQIKKHLDLGPSELAALLKMSYKVINNLSNKIYHCTIGQKISEMRIKDAIIWVLETDMELEDIAKRYNWSYSQFYRYYKQMTGVTPLDDRKNADNKRK